MGFKERLGEARKAKGLSQDGLGALLGGMSKQGISHWETGRYEPSVEQLQRLAEVLDVSMDWLLLGRSPESLPPDALAEAKFYNSLSADGKKRWRGLRMLFVDGVSDHAVEKKMPITKRPKEKQ